MFVEKVLRFDDKLYYRLFTILIENGFIQNIFESLLHELVSSKHS